MNVRSAGYVYTQQGVTQYGEWDRKPVGDGDGRVVQIWLGPDKRSTCLPKDEVALRVIVVYTRNSSSGMGDTTARSNFDELLY